jgi:hypothetical protein
MQPIGAYQDFPKASGRATERPGGAESSTMSPDAGAGIVQGSAGVGSRTAFPASGAASASMPNQSSDPDVGGSDAGADTTPQRDVCVPSTVLPAQRQRLDMYIVMDANITLPYTGLWEFATGGLRAFVQDPRSQGTGVGLRYYGTECDPDPYDTRPTVEVDLLPQNQAALTAATEMPLTLNASPMQPALEGGIRHQKKREMNDPESKQVVVLLTDGFTQDFTCSYTEQDIEDTATAGFNGTPQIETYVIGFGVPSTNVPIADDIIARFVPLDSIASAGGTRSADKLALGGDTSVMNEALQKVRREAQPCQYLVPHELDPSLLSLALVPGGELPRVDDAAKCGLLPGYWFDDNNAPTAMVLCPTSCLPLQQNDSQTAVLSAGCPPKRRD